MKMLSIIVLVISFLVPLKIMGQNEIVIKGSVTDKLGDPLSNANIGLADNTIRSYTDAKGNFILVLPEKYFGQNILLEVKCVGFETLSRKIRLINKEYEFEFQMTPIIHRLKDIIVSAQRREEYLQNVPISISIFNESQIKERGINRLIDLQYAVPNFFFGDGGFNKKSVSSIRGIAGYTRASGVEKRANYYLDDAYMGRSISIGMDLFDIERIEILKGPQGTLFGKNTISGAISITTRKPNNKWEASVSADAGNFNYYNANVILNLIKENMLFTRLSVKASSRDGYITNLYNNKDMNGLNILGGRLQLRYLPNPNLDIILSMNTFRDRRDPRSVAIPIEGPAYDLAPGPHEVTSDFPEYENRDIYGFNLNMTYHLQDNYNLKSITSYRNTENNQGLDHDALPIYLANELVELKDYHFTQELRLTSPLFEKYNFVSGLFYFYQKADLDLQVRGSADMPGLPNWNLDLYGPVTTNSIAWYIHGNFQLLNNLLLFGGLRYTYEYKTIKWDQFSDPAFYPNIENFTDTYSKGIFSPQVGLKYLPDNDIMIYAKASWGYKSGGWSNFTVNIVDKIKLKPEYSISYEAGLKLSAFDNRIIINTAAFLSKFDDYQTETWLPKGIYEYPSYTNAAEVTSKGLEIDLIVSPIVNLSILSSLGYVKAKYDEFDSPIIEKNYTGNRLELAPETEYSLSVEYEIPLINVGTFSLRGNFIHKGDYYWEPSNTDDYYVSAYDLIDGRIGYKTPEGSLGIYLWGKNLTDKLYMLTKSTLPMFKFAWYGMPRTFGIQVSYSFFSN